jgi:F0F1-type ATP synthase assembly protein I
VAQKPGSRSALAVGVEWASKVTTIAMGFSLPPVIGYALDRWWRLAPIATLAGTILGFVLGLLQVLALAREIPSGPSPRAGRSHRDSKSPPSPGGTTEKERPGRSNTGAK